MNEGWLCDSILKAQAHPSPMSMMPAFSPGPCRTRRLCVGNRFKCTREDLYEQCSLHMTLKIPSSVKDGSRPPRSCLMRSYSSGVMPWLRRISGVIARVVAEVVMEGNTIVAFSRGRAKSKGCGKQRFAGNGWLLVAHSATLAAVSDEQRASSRQICLY